MAVDSVPKGHLPDKWQEIERSGLGWRPDAARPEGPGLGSGPRAGRDRAPMRTPKPGPARPPC